MASYLSELQGSQWMWIRTGYLLIQRVGLGLRGRQGHPHLDHLLRRGQHDVTRVVVHAVKTVEGSNPASVIQLISYTDWCANIHVTT